MSKTRNSTHSKNALGKVGQSYKETHVNSDEKKLPKQTRVIF